MKGQAKFAWWFVYIAMIAVITVAIYLLVNSILSQRIDTHDIEFQLITERVVDSIAMVDPITGKRMHGHIDIHSLTTNSLKETVDEKTAIRVKIGNKEVYANKALYERGAPLAGLKTPSNQQLYILSQEKIPIIIHDNHKTKSGILEVRGIFS